MKRSKFTESQISFALQKAETGVKVEESFRRDYNSYRPHSSLQGMTPEEADIEYVKNPDFSTFELSEKWE